MRVREMAIALAAAAVTALSFIPRSGAVHAQAGPTAITAIDVASLRAWDRTVNSMARVGDLRVRRVDEDTVVAGRTHERLDQYYNGVPVRGGDIVRQLAGGSAVSIFGTVHSGIDLDVTPRLTADDALAVARRESGVDIVAGKAREDGVDLGAGNGPRLIILPHEGGYRLAYEVYAFTERGAFQYFIDANNGSLVLTLDAAQRQDAVGRGTGVLGDTKKMSVTQVTGGFQAADLKRPPILRTYDMKGDANRTIDILSLVEPLLVSDRAADSDNNWTDVAAVDAHAYSGYVYDYFFRRHNRQGLDGNNVALLSFVHPISRSALTQSTFIQFNDFFVNAFYYPPFGVMVYGEGLPPGVTAGGQSFNYFSGALDIVAHELTHGVTEYSSRLIYESESGALNESFSDMMGTAIEFFYHPVGSGPMRADYLIGEDVIDPPVRSLENPAAWGQPDHYSQRQFVGQIPDPANDNGGVHVNSGIPNHMYYLAIEGGTNRTSGLSVQGVGQANREQIERVMFRAFTQMMPADATFAVARSVTIQAARDLFGANSNAERAITQAWTAVGVS